MGGAAFISVVAGRRGFKFQFRLFEFDSDVRGSDDVVVLAAEDALVVGVEPDLREEGALVPGDFVVRMIELNRLTL